MSNEREEFQAWRLDFESDYDRKPTFLEVWQACAERKQREIEALAAQNERMRTQAEIALNLLRLGEFKASEGELMEALSLPAPDCLKERDAREK